MIVALQYIVVIPVYVKVPIAELCDVSGIINRWGEMCRGVHCQPMT